MEECCAVCAEPLEWVAYGPCVHKEVCSTCIARLRFVLNDKRCCICKQECPSVFVTKALGDYTKVIGDFEVLSNRVNVEKGGMELWYENNIQAYFDDEDHFKMIKAMCRLYCSVCEQVEYPSGKDFVKKGYIFRNLDLLRRHFYHAHKVQMCELCLEGRKVFICEQKLYNKAQLDRHLSRGDSEVDGKEEERDGFTGHPMCEFCRKRFYGDNELFQHMSTEHFTCHICQRLRPGRFDYYRNYDDLEAHFRHEHNLCEDEECLAKKFVVFTSDAELKRHNALVHGGNMSRAQRNAALQIPVSFQYRRPGQEHRENGLSRRTGRSRGAHTDSGISAAIHASIDSAILESTIREAAGDAGGTAGGDSGRRMIESSGPASTQSHESETATTSGEPSRYLSAVSGSVPSSLQESAFPPLPGTSRNARRKARQRGQNTAVSMAALLGAGRSGVRVLNSQDYAHSRSTERQLSRSSHALETLPVQRHNLNSMGLIENTAANNRQPVPVISGPWGQSSSSRGVHGGANTATNAVMSATEEKKGSNIGSNQLSVDEVRIANKVLIEDIRAALKGDEQHFTAFKDISSQFRKGEIDAKRYCKYIVGFGLSHLVPELARLCPDPVKQKDLIDAYHEGQSGIQPEAQNQLPAVKDVSGTSIGDAERGGMNVEKTEMRTEPSTVGLKLKQEGGRTSEGEVEVLSRDGYRDSKGKTKLLMSSRSSSSSDEASGARNKPAQVLVRAKQPSELHSSSAETATLTGSHGMWSCIACTLENQTSRSQCAACGMARPSEKTVDLEDAGGGEKRKKKTSKFQRVRLGDGSAAALLESRENPWGTDHKEETSSSVPPGGRSFGRGVWKKGGGQHLVSIAQRDALIDSTWSTK